MPTPKKDFANMDSPALPDVSITAKPTSKKSAEEKALEDRKERSTVIAHSLALAKLPELSVTQKRDPAIVEDRCEQYFDLCANAGIQPTTEGLALALSTPRSSLLRARRDGSWGSAAQRVIDKYLAAINASLTTLTLSGKIYANYASFLQKNNDGYTDKAEITVEAGDSLLSKDDLIKRADALDEAETAEQPPTQNDAIETVFEEKPQND